MDWISSEDLRVKLKSSLFGLYSLLVDLQQVMSSSRFYGGISPDTRRCSVIARDWAVMMMSENLFVAVNKQLYLQPVPLNQTTHASEMIPFLVSRLYARSSSSSKTVNSKTGSLQTHPLLIATRVGHPFYAVGESSISVIALGVEKVLRSVIAGVE
jgi:hypothetical protein